MKLFKIFWLKIKYFIFILILRMFDCEFCSKNFYSKSSLNLHIKTAKH